MTLIILEQDVVHVQIDLHAMSMVELAQRTTEQDAVEARNHSLNPILKTRDKLLHGVPFGAGRLKLETSFNLHPGSATICLRLAAIRGHAFSVPSPFRR